MIGAPFEAGAVQVAVSPAPTGATWRAAGASGGCADQPPHPCEFSARTCAWMSAVFACVNARRVASTLLPEAFVSMNACRVAEELLPGREIVMLLVVSSTLA